MKKELSILIPAYNYSCVQMVKDLCAQAEGLRGEGVACEIIVAEDGSTDAEALAANVEIASMPHCRYLRRSENVGRAAIRNVLAQEAQYAWLLFLDGDMAIPSEQFLWNWVESDVEQVGYGGYVVGKGEPSNLRYIYEKQCEPMHRAEERKKRPYQHFHTCNFLISREVMMTHPFDERFRHYGYEDVLLGKVLHQHQVPITHIDNPLGFCTFESNPDFVAKTEEGLRTLNQFRHDLRGYSRLLTFVSGIHISLILTLIRLWHRLFQKAERRNLCGSRPSLLVYKLYRLGYFLCLE